MEKQNADIVELWFDVLALHIHLHFLPDKLSFLYLLNWVHISIKATTNLEGSMFSFNSKENIFQPQFIRGNGVMKQMESMMYANM
jgi:hypothetical protein